MPKAKAKAKVDPIAALEARIARLEALLERALSPAAAESDDPGLKAAPPDVADGQPIAAAHINAIRSSVLSWPTNINANRCELHNATRVGIGEGYAPQQMLHIMGANAGGIDRITAIQCDRGYDAIGDSMDLVYGSYGAPNRAGRIACTAVGGGEQGFIFYAMTGALDGFLNEVLRVHGAGFTIFKCPQTALADPFMPTSSAYIYIHEPGNQVAIRVRTSTGAYKQAVLNLT